MKEPTQMRQHLHQAQPPPPRTQDPTQQPSLEFSLQHLNRIRQYTNILVPKVHASFENSGWFYLAMEWVDEPAARGTEGICQARPAEPRR